MTRDDTAPATKQDIRLLMDEIGKLYAANERWKDELADRTESWTVEMSERMEAWKGEVKEHFDVVAENIRHDFRGAFSDKLDQHEGRLLRLERQAGLRPRL